MARGSRGWLALAPATLALSVAVPSTTASGANDSVPREVPQWPDVPCIQVVDRSTTPILNLPYSLLEERPGELTDDEVEDSRRHQFFAFSRQRFENYPPLYITWADIERAAAVDPSVKPAQIGDEQVLETSHWSSDDWIRITPDDMRVPITHAQAALGVDWDVSGVSPGTWVVKGYAWEPIRNEWAIRWGGVKVIASAAEAEAAGPSVILLPDERVVESGVEYAPPGCIDAPDGSTVELAYGVAEGSLEPEWIVASESRVATGDLGVVFVPPQELVGQSVWFRATIADADGRSYVAYSPKSVSVLQGPEPATSSDSDSGGTLDEDDDGRAQGCGCAAGRGATLWSLVMLSACLRRRRRGANLRA